MKIGITCTLRQNGSPPGGLSGLDDAEEEFDSPATVAAIVQAIRSFGHEVEILGDGVPLIDRLLKGPRPDCVFNFAEGRGISRNREARVPALLEMLDIPYVGSDPLTLAATLDKDCAKRLVQSRGVVTPPWVLIGDQLNSVAESVAGLQYPLFCKPAFEGSSKGVVGSCLVQSTAELAGALIRLREGYQQPILVEEFIDGEELTVGLAGNPLSVIGVMRVIPRERTTRPFIYSLDVKRDYEQRVDYECPAQLSLKAAAAVRSSALAACQVLGCQDVARCDFRLRGEEPFFLEVNPLPGLNPISGDLVILSKMVGLEYHELIGRILQAGLSRIG